MFWSKILYTLLHIFNIDLLCEIMIIVNFGLKLIKLLSSFSSVSLSSPDVASSNINI